MCNLTIKRAETEELIALTSHHLTDETRQAAYDGKNVLRVRACAVCTDCFYCNYCPISQPRSAKRISQVGFLFIQSFNILRGHLFINCAASQVQVLNNKLAKH